MIKKALVLGGVISVMSVMFAAPSVIGTNGLINMPAASSIQYKEYDVGVNWEIFRNNQALKRVYYLANLGIFDGVELGLIGNSDQEGAFINLKYYMMSDQSKYPLGLAVGVTNLASRSITDVYLVLSKRFPNHLAGHFGFKSNLLAAKIQADVMFGMEMFLSEQMTVLADVIGSEDTWEISAGLRLQIMENLYVNGYLEDIGNATSDTTTFKVGVSTSGML